MVGHSIYYGHITSLFSQFSRYNGKHEILNFSMDKGLSKLC